MLWIIMEQKILLACKFLMTYSEYMRVNTFHHIKWKHFEFRASSQLLSAFKEPNKLRQM